MATIEIPADLAEELTGATEEAVRKEMLHRASSFVDITSLSDSKPRMLHVLTNKVLTVSGEWEDA